MMRGSLSEDKWAVFHTGGQMYLAERIINGEYEAHEIRGHCLACAKAELLARHGGQVDLRGWHKQGHCGAFLKAMQIGVNQEKEK